MPDGLAQHKLTRLLELRAVIDALRCEREAQDPLLAWVISRDANARIPDSIDWRVVRLRQCAPDAFRR